MSNSAHNIKDDPYESRLKALKLPSPKFSRKRSDMIQVFKIFAGIDRIEPDIVSRMSWDHGKERRKWMVQVSGGTVLSQKDLNLNLSKRP